MSMRTLPQQHCRNITDHSAHDWVMHVARSTPYALVFPRYCPGRYTPSSHHAPADSPTYPEDPFWFVDNEEE